MSSLPVSVRNKSSKFTLTKKEFYDNINKMNNPITIKNINDINNYQSEFSQYKKTILKKNKNNQIHNSNRFSLKNNNNTIDKSKKIINTFNTDFLKLFREIDILKKNKFSNKTAIEASLNDKNKFKSFYFSSFSNSKSKGKNIKKKQKNNFLKSKKNSKNKNLNINSTYELLNTNKKNNTINNTQRNVILTSNNKNKKFNLGYNNNLKKIN